MPKTNALATLPATTVRAATNGKHSRNAAIAAYRADTLEYAKASKAENTQRAYRAAWREFETWAAEHGAQSLPASPETVAAYLSALATGGAKFSTISVKRAAIGSAHRTAKLADPCRDELVRMVLGGIARKKRIRPTKKAPLTVDLVRQLVKVLDRSTLPGQRDAALLLVGFAGAFRRSELVAVDVEDVRLTKHELKITLKHSKTDQKGEGMVKVIPALQDESVCPVRALREWLNAARLQSGPVFRRFNKWGSMGQRLTAQSVAHIVKHTAEAAGLDARQFSGHSLRSGFITSAAVANVQAMDIAAQTGHKSLDVLRGYIQDAGQQAKRAVVGAFGETKR
jgi:site-specific recombinase XerD